MSVRRTLLVSLVLLVVAPLSGASAMRFADSARQASISGAPAFTANDLEQYAGGNWLTTGGGLTDDRYSTLDQINLSNVSKLQVAWHIHLGVSQVKTAFGVGMEGNAVAYNGVLYITTGVDQVFAIDGATGAKLWEYDAPFPQGFSVGLAVNRGVAVGDGRVYVGQVDGYEVALDQMTGAVLWRTLLGRVQEGYSMTSPSLYYNGEVIQGVSGGDSGARSFAAGLDAATGKLLWKWYVVPSPGDIGSATWFGNEWQIGGGAIWISSSVDPAAGLVYMVTGNPVPWNGRGPGMNLWTDSIVALRTDNGQFVWGFQTVHHDIWDYDVTNPPVIFDTMINGQLRHGIGVASKTGWVYLLDRFTGAPLLGIPEKKVPHLTGAAAKYANTWPTQPYPVGQAFVNQCATKKAWPGKAPDGKPFRTGCIFVPYAPTAKGTFVAFAPSATGGVDWPPSSYNPSTHFEYVCATDGPGISLGAQPKNQQALIPGQQYFGVTFGPASKTVKPFGRLSAIDVTTNTVVWSYKLTKPCYSGSLTTAGGLVFVGDSTGVYRALNAMTGDLVWTSDQLDFGVNAPGTTYTDNGKQYIAVLVGGNGLAGVKAGDSYYAFTLP
jgi:quinohemoprotein ethanol dehydrogenase